MLVLRRNVGEVLKIGPDIEVMVTEAGNGWARIGVRAPREVQVVRPEAKRQEPRR